MEESVSRADLSWSIVIKDNYIVHEANIGQSPSGITDVEIESIVRLVQDVVDDAVIQLRCSSASLPHSILYEGGRRKLPINQDGPFCVALEFFEEADKSLWVGPQLSGLAEVCQQC